MAWGLWSWIHFEFQYSKYNGTFGWAGAYCEVYNGVFVLHQKLRIYFILIPSVDTSLGAWDVGIKCKKEHKTEECGFI